MPENQSSASTWLAKSAIGEVELRDGQGRSSMMRRIVPIKFALVLASGLVVSSLSFKGEPAVRGDLPVVSQDQAEWTLDHAIVGDEQTLSCILTNNDSRPVKVLNAPMYCRPEGCITFLDPPIVIPAHASRTFRFEYLKREAGPIKITARIFLETADKAGIAVPITIGGYAFVDGS